MICNFSYIKQGVKYIIGAAILTTSLGSAVFGLEKDNNGYYQIGSSADLREFADLANGEEPNAKGKLLSDIEFNENKVVVNGKLQKGDFEKWIPIGTKKKPFEGELKGDGGIKKIIGLYVNNEESDYQGLFGYIREGGKITDIKIDGSYINGRNSVGGIAGCNEGKISNPITGSGCIIEGEWAVGGNIGSNAGAIIANCKNSGKVKGGMNVGGNIGRNEGTIKGKCQNNGAVTGKEHVGGNIGGSIVGNITGNCENEGVIEGNRNVGGNVGENGDIILQGDFINDGVVKGKNNVGMNFGMYAAKSLSYHFGGNGKLYEIKVNAQGKEELEQKSSIRYIIGFTDRKNKENLINTETIGNVNEEDIINTEAAIYEESDEESDDGIDDAINIIEHALFKTNTNKDVI